MAEVSGYKRAVDRYGSGNPAESDFVLACSLSGRVVHASAELKIRLGTELAGRNLNDFLDDKTVSDIIAKSAAGEYCSFYCLLGGKKYSALSEREGGAIIIAFYEEDEHSATDGSDNSLKYLQGEINVLLSNLLGALSNFGGEDNPTAMFARKNIYRLLRASRNVFDRVACKNGTIKAEKRDHDILEICTAVVDKLKFSLRSVDTELELWHDGERHISNCVSEHVEGMLANIISCVLKSGGKSAVRYLKVEIVSKEQDILISVLSPNRLLSDRMLVKSLSENGDCETSVDNELVQSLLTVKAMAAYNGGSFLMTAERDGDRLAILLPRVDDDTVCRFKSPGTKYMSGTNTALVELAEILPDSLY